MNSLSLLPRTPDEFAVPLAGRAEFEALPQKSKHDVLAKLAAIKFVVSAPGSRVKNCALAALAAQLSRSVVYEAARLWEITGNWRDLVDRRLVREWQDVKEMTALTPAMQAECAKRIAFHKGGVRRAWLALLRDLAARRAGPHASRRPFLQIFLALEKRGDVCGHPTRPPWRGAIHPDGAHDPRRRRLWARMAD